MYVHVHNYYNYASMFGWYVKYRPNICHGSISLCVNYITVESRLWLEYPIAVCFIKACMIYSQ